MSPLWFCLVLLPLQSAVHSLPAPQRAVCQRPSLALTPERLDQMAEMDADANFGRTGSATSGSCRRKRRRSIPPHPLSPAAAREAAERYNMRLRLELKLGPAPGARF
jgi:hypothetical protein